MSTHPWSHRTSIRIYSLLIAVNCAAQALAGPPPIIDGRELPRDFGPPAWIQVIGTGFGNNTDPSPETANGSEIDGFFAGVRDGMLYIGVSGNLESNSTNLDLFFDAAPGGQQRLCGDNADGDSNGLNRMGDDGSGNGLIFDAGFEADYFLTYRIGLDAYGQPEHHVHAATLPTEGGGVGNHVAGGSMAPVLPLEGPGPRGGVIVVDADNSNILGVAGLGLPFDGPPEAVATGVEIAVELSEIGWDGQSAIRVMGFINGPGHGFVSNQFIGGLPPGSGNLGDPRAVDLSAQADDQFLTLLYGTDADFDGDGILDGGDISPFIFNPEQDPGVGVTTIGFHQMTILNSDGSIRELLTTNGAVDFVLPNRMERLYANVLVDGVWAIQNFPIFPLENDPYAWPQQEYRINFGLNVAPGTPAPDVAWQITVTRSPVPAIPSAAPGGSAPVTEELDQVGGVVITPDRAPLAEPSGLRHDDHYRPPPTRFVRNDYEQADLRQGKHAKACAAGAVASSFKWLIGTYGLGKGPDGQAGTPDDYDPSLDDLVDELVGLMGITSSHGATVDRIMEAKKRLIAQHKLPLTTESEVNGTGSGVIAHIYDQMKRGQDVELHLVDPAKDDVRGHAVSLAGINKTTDENGKDSYDVVVRDDSNQSAPRGEDEKPQGRDQGSDVKTRPGYLPGLPGVNGASNIYAWTAESPTASGGGTSGGGAAGTARSTASEALGSGGTATPGQSRQILSESIRAAFLAEKFVVNLEGLGYEPGTPVNTAAEVAAHSARYLLRAAHDVMAYLEDPAAQNAALLEVYFYAGELIDQLSATLAMLPPDADHDDVPDAVDNCEYPNPDQGDCDSNGIGDVCELNPVTNCNSNGYLDACELASGEAEDCNTNGRPDDCDLTGDADGDEDVDLADYARLEPCLTGPCLESECAPPIYSEPCCSIFDSDADGDVDLVDFSVFQQTWTGAAHCGNSVLEEGEECDDGGQSPLCDADCTLAICGDGTLNPAAGEECDDSNNLDGDGCSAACLLEALPDCVILFDVSCPNAVAECGALFSGPGDCLPTSPLCADTPPQGFQVFGPTMMITLEGDLHGLSVHFAGFGGTMGVMEFFDAAGFLVDAPLWAEGDCLVGPVWSQAASFSRPVRSMQVTTFGGPVWIDTFHVNPALH